MKLAETIYQILAEETYAEETYAEEYKSPIHREQVRTKMRVIADKIANQLAARVTVKIADVIKKEAEEWNITIHCKNIEESALFSSIARDQVKLFAEYIANFILDKEG